MKAIVTGAAGFIGSHLCDHLLEMNYEVLALDNLSRGTLKNLAHLKDKTSFKFENFDLKSSPQDILPLIHDADYIFHLAGLADIVPSIENPLSYYENNVTASVHLIEAAKQCKSLQKFCYAASSSCYGIPENYPTTELDKISPQYPYALTKYLAEEAILHWAQVYKLPTVSLRLFNVYGPRSRSKNAYGAVMGTFLAQKNQGKPLTIVGDGKQRRDFIYVTDVARAFVKAALSSHQNEVFNIGASQPQEIRYLASLISDKTISLPKRPGEPNQTYADITKAKSMLDWVPEVTLEEGLRKIIEANEDWSTVKAWDIKEIERETKSWFKALTKED